MLMDKCFLTITCMVFIANVSTSLMASKGVNSTQQSQQVVNNGQVMVIQGLETRIKELVLRVASLEDCTGGLTNTLNTLNTMAIGNFQLSGNIEGRLSSSDLNIKKLKNEIKGLQNESNAIQENLINLEETVGKMLPEVEKAKDGAKNEIEFYAHQVIKPLLENRESLEEKLIVAKEAAKAAASTSGEAHIKGIEIECEARQKIIKDNISQGAVAIIAIVFGIYIINYTVPGFFNYLTRPYVVSETSKTEIFEWFHSKPIRDDNTLIFTPSLYKQLADLTLRVQTAKKYNENLPNILFHGVSGTGKTAFVKALAYSSGLDYALTSGSEFAKITDLNHANNELRNLLNWAKKSDKGLILFIDEAESLFANRKLTTTSKVTQDFINTFLSLVSNQSQKKIMFIFATNHPFKLDAAVTNRIGINIEFVLPGLQECEKIFSMYLIKFSNENKEALVGISEQVMKSFSQYALMLNGLSPRSIRFIAEEIIIKARRIEPRIVLDELVIDVINQAKKSLQQMDQWEKDFQQWQESCYV
ncbi:MAG: hypothetical protein US69_C0006G0001 [candidate division TM6 bacterium GW2011_GWF2_38_10]|nr:MAG: hypothetical protein US69_C0006G0001 [candidate division TM6 bacterium GW2011_GWF2_38_10]